MAKVLNGAARWSGPNIRHGDIGDDSVRFTIEPRDGTSIVNLLGDAVKEHGWAVQEMRVFYR